MSTNEIAMCIKELKDITTEIKRRCDELSKLRKRKDELDLKIGNFLKEKDQPGIKFQGIAVIAEDKTKKLPKKKAQRTEDALNVLKHYGIDNAQKIFDEMKIAMEGDEVFKKVVKIVNNK